MPDVRADEYPFFLVAYEHAVLGNGQYANLPALEELPDPMTSAMWGSWVEINPSTAESLGINDADLVEVRTAYGAVTAPALRYPAIRPDTIGIPYGHGHSVFGRYASGRGANTATLMPPPTSSGDPVGVRATLTRLGQSTKLIRFGTDLQERMEKRR
jgi:anaerobic selenocysteine-containing dehydrogenase